MPGGYTLHTSHTLPIVRLASPHTGGNEARATPGPVRLTRQIYSSLFLSRLERHTWSHTSPRS